MKCALVRWWMEEYIDGTIDSKRARWMQAHLQQCQACAQELAWHRSLHEALKPELLNAPSSQQMWQDFQHRLAERAQPARTTRIAWWQWGAATAAVACALVLGMVWWSERNPVSEKVVSPEPSSGQHFASAERQHKSPAVSGAESITHPPSLPTRSPAVKPIRTAKAPLVRRPEPSPSLARVTARPTTPTSDTVQSPAPQAFASIAYAEVRNEQGELVGRVLLQTTFDKNGQPRAVQIECNTPAAVEVESNGEPMDSSDNYGDNSGATGSPTPTAGNRPGLSD